MAKKKRRKHRRPVAPPVHSAPDSAHAPPARPAAPFSTRPSSPEPPVAGEPLHEAPVFEPESRAAPVQAPRKAPGRRRPPSRRRRRNTSRWVIAGLVIVAIIAAFVVRGVVNGRRSSTFGRLAKSADCGAVKSFSNLPRTHEQGVRISYRTSPPVGGPHDPTPLAGGVYDSPFSTDPAKRPSVYQAVHSLEHGYVIVWYKNLNADQKDALTKALSGQSKVIVVEYPDMPDKHKMALTAWGKLDYCGRPSVTVAQAFIKLYRNAPSAPEYYQPAL